MARSDEVRPTTRRLVSVAAFIWVLSIVGFVLALIFQWPAQFVIGEPDPNVTLGDFFQGTVTSIPMVPWLALGLFALLATSRRWWGTVGVVGLCLLGVVFTFGGMNEAFAPPTPHVSRTVLVVAGVLYGILGLSLLLSGIAELVDRTRVRQSSRVR